MKTIILFCILIIFGTSSCARVNIKKVYTYETISSVALANFESKSAQKIIEELRNAPAPSKDIPEYKFAEDCLKKLLDYYPGRPEHVQKINLIVVPTDIQCRSLPPNTIVVSKSLLDYSKADDERQKDIIIGLFAHELCHLWWRHTEAKWGWIIAHDQKNFGEAQQIISSILSTTLPVKISITHVINAYSASPMVAEWYTESSADLFALITLDMMGKNSRAYVEFNEKLSRVMSSESRQAAAQVAALERLHSYHDLSYFLKPNLIEINASIVEKTGQIRRFKLNDISLITEIVREGDSHYWSPSFASSIRAVNYWLCAVRQMPHWHELLNNMPDRPVFISGNKLDLYTSSYELPIKIGDVPSFLVQKNLILHKNNIYLSFEDAYKPLEYITLPTGKRGYLYVLVPSPKYSYFYHNKNIKTISNIIRKINSNKNRKFTIVQLFSANGDRLGILQSQEIIKKFGFNIYESNANNNCPVFIASTSPPGTFEQQKNSTAIAFYGRLTSKNILEFLEFIEIHTANGEDLFTVVDNPSITRFFRCVIWGYINKEG